MRILHVAEIGIGGVASHIEEIGKAQIERYGIDNIAIIVPKDQIGEFRSLPPKVLRPFSPAKRRLTSAWRVARNTVAVARALRPHIIHAHSTFAGLAVRMLPHAALGNVKIVYCPHGWSFAMDGNASVKRVYGAIERLLSSRCDAIINVSAHERGLAIKHGIPSRRLHVIVNGISSQAGEFAQANDADGPIRLAFVGRPDRAKGLDVLLNAMRRLSDKTILLDVIGTTASDVESSMLPLGQHIKFHGWCPRERVQQHIALCDGLIMPSRWEGLPLTALEAMRAGKAIVASRGSSFPEIIDHGSTGLLFETANPAALAECLDGLTKPALAHMGRAARARFLERFTLETQDEAIAHLYEELVRQP